MIEINRLIAIAGAWIEAHPVFATVVLWPLVTAIVTGLFKPRTEAEGKALAADHPLISKVLRLIAALGLDAPKVMQALRDMLRRGPPSPPTTLGSVLLMVGALALAVSSTGCALFTAKNARMLLDLAETTCILAHQDLVDTDVAKVCGLTEPFIEPMKRVLASSRMASAKAAADASARAGAARCVAP